MKTWHHGMATNHVDSAVDWQDGLEQGRASARGPDMRNAETGDPGGRAHHAATRRRPDVGAAHVADRAAVDARCGMTTRKSRLAPHSFAIRYRVALRGRSSSVSKMVERRRAAFDCRAVAIDGEVRLRKTAQLLPPSNEFTILTEPEGSRSCPDVASSLHISRIRTGTEPFA